ncbi:MAG: RsmB/NOP family class I SAM-dependent RNA methyltransferase [Myxococcales bacterium]|nr:RsmB/NOP family class I SAM-dependent RNA methyltransferase [Myxococcales bacterium]
MTPAEQRVRDVPWEALEGIRELLGAPIDEMLAGSAAERVLDRFLRAHREFSEEQRRVCAEAIFGVGLWRRRLQLFPSPRPSPHGGGEGARLLDALVAFGGPPSTDWRDRFSVPDWLAKDLVRAVGDEAPALAAALNLPGPVCFRVNRRQTSRHELAAALLAHGVDTTPGHHAADCLVLTTPRPNVYALSAALPGHFEVQDEGSQLLAHALGLSEGAHVLDLCAGAGGKSLHLAALVGPSGKVHAADADLARLERLRHRASKAGVTVTIHGATPPDELRVPFVLVDAPCSELGALRRGPDSRWRLDPHDFERLPALQRELLERGLHHLAPGGRLVYATCTLRPEENEEVIDAVLSTRKDVSLAPPVLDAELLDARGFLRLFPHRHGTDGFFAALLAKR